MKAFFSSFENLHTLLLSLVLLMLLPALGFSLYSGFQFRNHTVGLTQENTLQMMRVVSDVEDHILDSSSTILSTLSLTREIKRLEPDSCSTIFQSLLRMHHEFTNIFAVLPDGSPLCSVKSLNPASNFIREPFFQAAMRNKGKPTASVRQDPESKLPLITFSCSVQDDQGQTVAMLCLDFSPSYFGQMIVHAGLPVGSTVVIADAQGKVFFRHPNEIKWLGAMLPPPFREVAASAIKEGTYKAKGLDGRERVYSIRQFNIGPYSNDLFMRVGVPVSHVLATADSLLYTNLFFMCCLVLLALAAARFIGLRFILRRVSILVNTAMEIKKGNFKSRSKLGHLPGEFGLLARSFDSMARGLARREEDHLKSQELLRQTGERVKALINASSDSVILIDADGTILTLNDHAAKRRNSKVYELVGQSVYATLEPEFADKRQRMVSEVVRTGRDLVFEESRDHRHYRIRIYPVFDANGRVTQLASFSRDVTLKRKAEKELQRLAFNDSLTALSNRASFTERLKESIALSLNNSRHFYAVLFLDLDNFKLVNDSFGHMVGDKLLQLFARRIQAFTLPGLTTARFGGDEFALLLDGATDHFMSLKLADDIHNLLRSPFQVQSYEITVSASIGLVLSDSTYHSPNQVLRDADIAMYNAKSRGKGTTSIFDRNMREGVVKRLRLEQDLTGALARGEIFLLYQPFFSVKDMSLAGFEALVRWNHPEKGLIPPSVFIPVAEETGQILPLGEHVLKQACAQMKKWVDLHQPVNSLSMNVNFSAKQFLQGDPVELTRTVLEDTGLSPKFLKIEITESLLMDDMTHTVDILQTLKHFGLRTALDDFGTGFSSLSYLRDLPLDSIKMDRSFVIRLDQSRKDAEIVRIIVDLAHTLGMDVIAEGIENLDILKRLEGAGCDYAQGYYMCKPVPPELAEHYFK